MSVKRRFELTEAARKDVERLNTEDSNLARRAVVVLSDLRRGEIEGEQLAEMAATGDLADCRKLYFGAGERQDTHRIVYRQYRGGHIEVLEVVAVEQRGDLYVYLLAAYRLGRLPHESRDRFEDLRRRVIERRRRRR